MKMPEAVEDLKARKSRAAQMGGPERVARQRERGKLDARARIEALFDSGTFDEYGALATAGGALPEEEDPTKPSSKLPNVRANLHIKDCHGTFEDATPGRAVPTVQFASITGEAKIPDINSPITNSLEIVAGAGQGSNGTIKANGSSGANNSTCPSALGQTSQPTNGPSSSVSMSSTRKPPRARS